MSDEGWGVGEGEYYTPEKGLQEVRRYGSVGE